MVMMMAATRNQVTENKPEQDQVEVDAVKPVGRERVKTALIEATIELILSDGPQISVRRIAEKAGVNHGLVHTYFGNKQALVTAALDQINRRAAAELDEDGFPPVDLANRRGGELARAIARMRLDEAGNLFSSHPIAQRWLEAWGQRDPGLDEITKKQMVVAGSTLALGWAVFAEHLLETAGVSEEERPAIEAHIIRLVAELGGLPDTA